jgi:hypothetical protein
MNLSEMGSCEEILCKNENMVKIGQFYIKLRLTSTQMASCGKIRTKNLIFVNIEVFDAKIQGIL